MAKGVVLNEKNHVYTDLGSSPFTDCLWPARKATQTSSKQTSASSQTVTSASEEQKEGVSIDGSYRGQDEENTILLVVTGQKGTFTVQDADGEEETKEVSIDSVNQSMRIGDEPYRYRIEGDQLSLEDLEQAEDDQGIIVLTKQ